MYRGRDVAYFIQQYGSPLSLIKPSGFVFFGICKGTGFVAEQLGFYQGVWKGTTVDGHKWTGGLRAVMVNCPGKKFLAGTALTFNQNGAGALGNLGKYGENVKHFIVLADNIFEGVLLFELSLEFVDIGQVPECHDTTDQLVVRIFQNCRCHVDGDAFLVSPDDVKGLVWNRLPGFHDSF